MGLLESGMNLLADLLAESESELVQYVVPPSSPAQALRAVIGGPGFNQENNVDAPARLGGWNVDFIVKVADFQVAFAGSTPMEGDLITYQKAGWPTSRTFRVFAGNNVPAWDWGEPEQITYRIHARYSP